MSQEYYTQDEFDALMKLMGAQQMVGNLWLAKDEVGGRQPYYELYNGRLQRWSVKAGAERMRKLTLQMMNEGNKHKLQWPEW